MFEISPQKLAEIVRLLSAVQRPWGIFAGAAASVYGSARPIKDIDILIPSDAGEQAASFLSQADLVRDADGRIAMLVLPGFDIIAGLTENISLEMDAEMVNRLVQCELLGVEVMFLSLEDNLIFKAVLGRGPEVGKHDWADIADMLACVETLDWNYLRWRLCQCAPNRLDEIIARLQNIIELNQH